MIRRLALGIIRRYPAAWRERYETEVTSLIEDSPARLHDLSELLRGLITERARELMSATDKPKRTAAVLTWMPAAFGLAFTGLAVSLGLGLQRVAGILPVAEYDAFSLAVVVLIVVLGSVQIVAAVRHSRLPQPKPAIPQTPARVACLLLPFVFLLILVSAWGDVLFAGTDSGSGMPWQMNAIVRGWLYFYYLAHLTGSFWPGRDLLHTLGALEAAEGHLRMSETWVQSCREWIARGVPSPLDEALAQVERWTIERDAARARLQELGYGARFRTPAA